MDGAWKVFCDISDDISINYNNDDEINKFAELVNQLKDLYHINAHKICKTQLQSLIQIGIEMKLLHFWILLTTSYKNIVQKYFNTESTLLDASQINYCAFKIYNYIK